MHILFKERNAALLDSQQAMGKAAWRKSAAGGPNQESSFTQSESFSTKLNIASGGPLKDDGGRATAATDGGKMKFGWIEGVLIRCMARLLKIAYEFLSNSIKINNRNVRNVNVPSIKVVFNEIYFLFFKHIWSDAVLAHFLGHRSSWNSARLVIYLLPRLSSVTFPNTQTRSL